MNERDGEGERERGREGERKREREMSANNINMSSKRNIRTYKKTYFHSELQNTKRNFQGLHASTYVCIHGTYVPVHANKH